MVDPEEAIKKARDAVSERAELPGMSLMEHLDELRRRIVHSAIYLGVGFLLAWFLHDRLVNIIQALFESHWQVTRDDAPDGCVEPGHAGVADWRSHSRLAIHFLPGVVVHCAGAIPKERRFVFPFITATVGLFLSGAAFGYFWVLPGALKILVVDFGHNFTPMVTIEEYSSFFLSIILGLGISFEMPIIIFFLAMFGIVSPKFLWKNIRYAILAVFVVAAFICPSPDPWTMCIYAIPMLSLYVIGIGVAWWVHPSRKRAKEAAN